MSLFDKLVDEALASRDDLNILRPVVEKELLHHDILREMSEAGLLRDLTFIGGTCLRACYGSFRLSEDLDFTGGESFERRHLAELGEILTKNLQKRYNLPVRVSEPSRDDGNVSTWKMTVETRPTQPHLPAQRIHLDICAIPSHDPRPMMLRNLYQVDLGTAGLILQAESREEILADKIVALAFRRNRIKNRDLWDIAWLNQQGVNLPGRLIPLKLQDHKQTPADFRDNLLQRTSLLQSSTRARADFLAEMRRFLPAATIRDTVSQPDYWQYLLAIISDVSQQALRLARHSS